MRSSSKMNRQPRYCCKGGGRRAGGGGAATTGGGGAVTVDRRFTRGLSPQQTQRLGGLRDKGQVKEAARLLRRSTELENRVATSRVQRNRDRAQTELDQINTQLRNLGI